MQFEENRLRNRRLLGDAETMCLVAKFGNQGPAFVPHERIVVTAANAGRLYLQANDRDLKDNTGSLDVEIEFHR